MLSKTEHELPRQVRPNEAGDEPKRVKERTDNEDSNCTKSITNGSDPRRLIPNADINESKRAELRDDDGDSM